MDDELTPAETDPLTDGSDDPGQTEQERVRREKLTRLRAAGVDPYPVVFERTDSLTSVRARHGELPPDALTGDEVAVAGRVMLNRTGGKLCFATLREGPAELQVMISLDGVGEDALAAWKSDVDLGDQVGVVGEVITSRRGELSVLARRWTMTSKALRPLPEKHKGLTDPEARVRRRYVDLIANPESQDMVRTRAIVLRSLREVLTERSFLEVETPILTPLLGGAARPFATHLNAFDVPMYLRTNLELNLKRLIVGGMDRVFEIGRNFRNEGIDATHSPEFTMLEAYEAYGTYDTMADLTRELVLRAARATGRTVVPDGQGGEIDLEGPWRSVTVHGAVSDALGESVTPDSTAEALASLAGKAGVGLREDWSADDIVLELYEKLVEPTITTPTFVKDYPAGVRPLARPHRDDPRLAEAWDLVIAGAELAPAYSELNDPIEQRARFVEQARRAAGGDAEAIGFDEDFLRALEYGMPPTGGMGLGVDRLMSLLTGRNFREVITFPLVRPE